MRALQMSGRWYTVDEVMSILNRDRYYWGGEKGELPLAAVNP